MNAPEQSIQLQEYKQRQLINQLRRELFAHTDPSAMAKKFRELSIAEQKLSEIEEQRKSFEKENTPRGVILSLGNLAQESFPGVLGAESTGLDVQVNLRMSQIPTSIYHLFDPERNPLITCTVRNASTQDEDDESPYGIRRVRLTSFIEGYSAKAMHSIEIRAGKEYTFNQLPTLFPESIRDLTELARATLNVLVEDLDTGKVETHMTYPIWLLARTTAPLYVHDPNTGDWQDFTPYLGAFVTPNAISIMELLRMAADLHEDKRFVGYQGDPEGVESQIEALFNTLKLHSEITYVNSVISFSPEEGFSCQRVRLPRESLAHKEANCIDGTVLFASLIEAVSMSPAIVLVPGHAFLAWQTWSDQASPWKFLETTMIRTHSFTEACQFAKENAASYKRLAEETGDKLKYRMWPLSTLRAEYKIFPME